MFKRINSRGIIILASVLAIIHFGFGLVISPALKSVIADKINENSACEVTLEKVHIWPLTLSVSLGGLKVSDPKDKTEIVNVGKASVRLSFWALLSKRIVLSYVTVKNTKIYLRREPDGSFNIQQLGESTKPSDGKAAAKAPRGSVFDRFKAKKDWFGMIYDAIKKRSSKEAVEKEIEERKESNKVTREVIELPKGRKVWFKTVRDDYLFEIQRLSIKNTLIHLDAGKGQTIDVEKASINIQGIVMDSKRGVRFDRLVVKGALKKGDKSAGSFTLKYSQGFSRDTLKTEFDFKANSIDMEAISFIYKDSLPVVVERGILDLNSKTDITGGEIDSRNTLSLREQFLSAKGGQAAVGFIPMPILVEAMNKVNPLVLKFNITGTVDKPQFSGFTESLMEMVKPYILDVKEQGIKAIGGFLKDKLGSGSDAAGVSSGSQPDPAQKVADSIKSLFSSQEK